MCDQTAILEQLEHQRKLLGMSMRVLSERSGLSLPAVQLILAGKKSCNLSSLAALSEVLGADINVKFQKPSKLKRQQAREKADLLIAAAQGSAALEAQAVGEKVLNRARREIEKRLLSGPPLRLWG